MFGSFRKHQKWIWILGVIVIIPSFVIFFSPDAKWAGGAGGETYNLGSIGGEPIKLNEFRPAFAETKLNYFFRSNGTWPGNEENAQRSLERDTIFRIFLIKKLKELDIHVSEKAVASMARERLGPYPLANFEKEHLQKNGLTISDFERFLRHEAGIQQLVGVAAASAKVMNPSDAEIIYRKQHEEVATEAAVFWTSNFLDKVTVTPAAIGQFFTNRMSFYRIPERIRVSYIEFPMTNYFADADTQIKQRTNFNAVLDEEYAKRGTNAFKGTNGVVLTEAAAKAQIKDELREYFAMQSARKAASDFGNELFDKKNVNVQTFENLAAAKGLLLKVSPAFDRVSGLDDTNFPAAFRDKALALNDIEPISYSPIVGKDAIYLIALKNKVPSEMPPFEKIQDKVTNDYKNQQALDLARKAGNSFQQMLTNGLAQKKTFSELAAQAKVKTVAIPPFSATTTSLPDLDPRINMRMLQGIIQDLQPGQASGFVPTQDGGFVLFLREKLPFIESLVQESFPDFMGKLRVYRQNEAFNQWFRKQAELAKLTLPTHESDKGSAGGAPKRSR